MADSTPIIIGDRERVVIGNVVALKGVMPNGKIIPCLIVKIHEPGVLMTNPDGSEKPWNGVMPIIDLMMVDRKQEDTPVPLSTGNDQIFGASESEGIPTHIQKIPWAGDIERNMSFLKLPPGLRNMCPRYLIISDLVGS